MHFKFSIWTCLIKPLQWVSLIWEKKCAMIRCLEVEIILKLVYLYVHVNLYAHIYITFGVCILYTFPIYFAWCSDYVCMISGRFLDDICMRWKCYQDTFLQTVIVSMDRVWFNVGLLVSLEEIAIFMKILNKKAYLFFLYQVKLVSLR